MVQDRQKVWTDGRNGRTDGCTDDAKTISLRLRRGIKTKILSFLQFKAIDNKINQLSRADVTDTFMGFDDPSV